jgi:hypothetical protein
MKKLILLCGRFSPTQRLPVGANDKRPGAERIAGEFFI